MENEKKVEKPEQETELGHSWISIWPEVGLSYQYLLPGTHTLQHDKQLQNSLEFIKQSLSLSLSQLISHYRHLIPTSVFALK